MATLRALIVSFDSGTWIATVRMDGSPAQTVDVPANRAIAAADMTAGSRAIVDTGDHNHPADAVVTAVWPGAAAAAGGSGLTHPEVMTRASWRY